MKRTHANALIDLAAFITFLLLSTELILEYPLPPGSGGLQGHGSGRGAAQRTLYLLWGRSQHESGTVHDWIAVGMLAILTAHLVLHWKWIVCTMRGSHTDASGHRLTFDIAGLIFFDASLICSFLE